MWDKWQEDVVKYVAGYAKCQKAKAEKYSRQIILVPMPIEERPFKEVALDFIGELPESEAFDVIPIITDRFTKIHYYIPAKDDMDHRRCSQYLYYRAIETI